jgi:iron complex outermembrane recepter protein
LKNYHLKFTYLKPILFFQVIVFLAILTQERINAQSVTLSGKVSQSISHEPLAGASVFFENSGKGTISNNTGGFIIDIPVSHENLVVSYLGFKTKTISPSEYENSTALNIELDEDFIAFSDGVIIVGSHSGGRSNLASSVPVDQFPSSVLEQTGQSDLSQQINSLAPSFFSTRLTYSDATDHMDPAALRGLNPDQTLILVNGKRHHPSAVVNTLGVVSRGSVINDLNTIPASSISRIEVLRDGASAQYGSDAIAGVINIVLKENTGKLNLKSQVGQYYEGDGLQTSFAANYGFKLAKKGFVNLTSEFRRRESTNRAGIYQGLIYRSSEQDGLTLQENTILDNQNISARGLTRQDFRMQLGNSAMSDGNIYLNAILPVYKTFEIYSFGGTNLRNSKSAGDFRLPNDPARSNLFLHPNGFLPEIQAHLNDEFISTGIRGKISEWNSDLSYTFGRNAIAFFVNNSANASMGAASPSNFKSGGISYRQSIINFDINRDFAEKIRLEQFLVSLGSEYRLENYRITAGEESSWLNQDKVSYPGAQGYPGYQPSDETIASRNNFALYVDLSTIPIKHLLIDAAGRFENYSDFGSNVSGKLSSRYSVTPWFNIRGSVSTGFRAPSLHQSWYSYTGSYYAGGYLYDVLTARNNNPVTSAFGIPALKEETSNNYSLGLTAKPAKNTSLTIDFFQIDVQNRIVLSGSFYKYYGNQAIDSILANLPTTGGAQFFTNAVDTRTKGVDFIFSHEIIFSKGLLGASFGLDYSQTRITGNLHSSNTILNNGLSEQFFDTQSRGILEHAQPSLKYNFTLNYVFSKFSCVLRNTYYGKILYFYTLDYGSSYKDQAYTGKWITDIKLSFRLNEKISVSVGANNLFNIYPDKNVTALQHDGRFPYNTAVTQFGFNGGYYYGGLSFDL